MSMTVVVPPRRAAVVPVVIPAPSKKERGNEGKNEGVVSSHPAFENNYFLSSLFYAAI
jgi:hypothetical protein